MTPLPADERREREKQIGLSMPLPLSARLDGLVALASAEGTKTTRKDLVAGLIHERQDVEELALAIKQRRLAIFGRCVIAGQDPEAYLEASRPRGPRDPDALARFLRKPSGRRDAQLQRRPLKEFPTVQFSIAVPHPINDDLNRHVAALTESGERTTRREVVEALILNAIEDGDELTKLISAARSSSARDD